MTDTREQDGTSKSMHLHPVAPRLASALLSVALAAAVGACGGDSGVSAARGKQIYTTCEACHGPKGQGNPKVGAPNIAGLPKWYIVRELQKFQVGQRGSNPADTVGRTMAVVATTIDGSDDLESVATYISDLPPQPAPMTVVGNVQKGRVVYQSCYTCHAKNGKGRVSVTSGSVPPLTGLADWYIVSQIEAFKKGWRGTSSTDYDAGKMRAVVIPLDSADIADVTAYIRTLK